jgi:hypothetical protein
MMATQNRIPVTVHRGDCTACVAADASASAGTIARQAFDMMGVQLPPNTVVGLAKADGTMLDTSALVEPHSILYGVQRRPDGTWDAPSKSLTIMLATENSGSLTQRLPPPLAQYVMAQRPSPVVL